MTRLMTWITTLSLVPVSSLRAKEAIGGLIHLHGTSIPRPIPHLAPELGETLGGRSAEFALTRRGSCVSHKIPVDGNPEAN